MSGLFTEGCIQPLPAQARLSTHTILRTIRLDRKNVRRLRKNGFGLEK